MNNTEEKPIEPGSATHKIATAGAVIGASIGEAVDKVKAFAKTPAKTRGVQFASFLKGVKNATYGSAKSFIEGIKEGMKP